VADSANFPYGTKTSEEIKNIVISSIEKIIDKLAPDIIVIACNTASVVVLSYLRNRFNIPFVGVVPAVKPAAIMSRNKKIGLFATNKTVSDNYISSLIDQFAAECEVFKFANPDIVSFIENRIIDADNFEITELLKPATDFFIEKGVDYVILGCTHFLFLDTIFNTLFPKHIKTIDSREGVCNQIIHLLDKFKNNDFDADKEKSGKTLFFTTSLLQTEYYKRISDKFIMEYSGII
jgi:glutamate racemase